jgi:hypothetical protein
LVPMVTCRADHSIIATREGVENVSYSAADKSSQIIGASVASLRMVGGHETAVSCTNVNEAIWDLYRAVFRLNRVMDEELERESPDAPLAQRGRMRTPK